MKLLIFILTYNAERTIQKVLTDLPDQYKNSSSSRILVVDDASADRTVEIAQDYARQTGLHNIQVLKNRVNQGYGGNQKVGYRYAIQEGFDAVAMLHGDAQYTPTVLPDLFKPLEDDPAVDCVLGVRFGRDHSPLEGGMPLYKFIGNRILTWTQNHLAHVHLSEWHTGYRVYRVKALSEIAFEQNTNDFHFDTEILLQFIDQNREIAEFNIPTRYADEKCHVNGLRYAKDVFKATLKHRLQQSRWAARASSARRLPELLKQTQTLIFDFDGTLVDSNPIKLRGFDACFARFTDHWEEIKAYCYSNHHTPRWEKFRHVYEQILKRPYTPAIEKELHAQYEAATTRQVSEAPEIPGAARFLKQMSGRFSMAVVSTTPDAILRQILDRRGWTSYFRAIQGAPVNKASWVSAYLQNHRLQPKQALFFGDTAEDAQAARAAGCPFVAVASGMSKVPDAAAVLPNFLEVLN